MPREAGYYGSKEPIVSLAGQIGRSWQGRESVDTVITVGVASTVIVSTNLKRVTLLVSNSGANDVWLALGGASVIGTGRYLKAGGGVLLINKDDPWSGEISGIAAAPNAVGVSEVSIGA